jgi:hypothetical protein
MGTDEFRDVGATCGCPREVFESSDYGQLHYVFIDKDVLANFLVTIIWIDIGSGQHLAKNLCDGSLLHFDGVST